MDIELSGKWRKLETLKMSKDKLDEYDVMVLPENFYTAQAEEEIWDAQDAIRLSKLLKQEGLKCANSYDLKLDVPTLERRSHDIWFGEIFILKDLVVPTVVGVIYSILTPLIQAKLKKKEKRAPSAEVHVEISLKKDDSISTIKYSGDPETLMKILFSLYDGKQIGDGTTNN